MKYFTANRYRGEAGPEDINGSYLSYDQARENLRWDDDSDNAILTLINDRYYRVSALEGELKYRPLDNFKMGWHTYEEILRGTQVKDISVNNMMALAASIAYCDGSLAKALEVPQEELYAYDFWDRFAEYFGKPMYEYHV